MAHAGDSVGTIWRMVAAIVLLLVVAMPALAPTVFALEHKAGSAFNAATDDVSLPASAPSAEIRLVPAPQLPASAIPDMSPLPLPLSLDGDSADSHMRTTRGPPAADTTFSPLIQTGPPAA